MLTHCIRFNFVDRSSFLPSDGVDSVCQVDDPDPDRFRSARHGAAIDSAIMKASVATIMTDGMIMTDEVAMVIADTKTAIDGPVRTQIVKIVPKARTVAIAVFSSRT